MHRRTFAALLLNLTFLPVAAFAAATFAPLPVLSGESPSGLVARVVSYDGHTNGQMVVEVKNPSAGPVAFTADGLYFVPQVHADQAPQRLGAVGGFDVTAKGETHREEKLTIAAGEAVTVRLDVFCIDSHRSSPGPETPYRIATDRLPKSLTQAIDREARPAAGKSGGFAAPASKSSTQGSVWKNRDANWIELQGEGSQEKARAKPTSRNELNNR